MKSAEFIIAVSSSLTTAAILFIVRQLWKARKTVSQLADEHHFLMESMNVVLEHLKLTEATRQYRRRP